MSHPEPAMDRRGFLRSIGAVAGSAALSPVAALGLGAAPERGALRVGVLLPPAPAAGESFLEGMRLALGEDASPRLALSTRTVAGPGGAATADAARRLVDGGAQVLVGPISSLAAAALRPLLAERRVPLLVTDLGARAPAASDESPWIFRCTGEVWSASFALGAWAAREVGRRALVVTSLYDAGFDHLHAAELGFAAGGGELLGTRVLDAPARPIELEAVLAEVKALAPDVVCAILSGERAVELVAAYDRAGLARRIPLVGSAFLADEKSLPIAGRAAVGIRTCGSWSPALDSAANRAFVTGFERLAGRAPDLFAVLGFEAAKLLAASGGDPAALGRAELASPRGRVRMDPATRGAVVPCYVREVRERAGRLENAVLGEVASIAAHDERASVLRHGVKTGWLGAYLC